MTEDLGLARGAGTKSAGSTTSGHLTAYCQILRGRVFFRH